MTIKTRATGNGAAKSRPGAKNPVHAPLPDPGGDIASRGAGGPGTAIRFAEGTERAAVDPSAIPSAANRDPHAPPPLHLLRLAVGIRDLDHLADVQAPRRQPRAGQLAVYTITKRLPTRGGELLGGGSLYWVIKGVIRVRQPFIDLESIEDEAGQPWARLWLGDPVQTEPRLQRPFQGWRYLKADAAPADLGQGGGLGEGAAMPDHMIAELRDLGLI